MGATGLVGQCAMALLRGAGHNAVAFSRKPCASDGEKQSDWRCLAESAGQAGSAPIPNWLSFAPVWTLPEHFSLLDALGVRRMVVISSTSRFTKQAGNLATSPAENELAQRLADGEAQFQSWAAGRGIEWVILRPTMIYALGRDRNLSEIARIVRKFGFFPLLGEARGLRQPIHAEDVAAASIASLFATGVVGRAYNISGGETLTYRDMVGRVFVALGRKPRFVKIPLFAFQLALAGARLLPRYRGWSSAMAERMNRDLVFDHADAARDFGFKPRRFELVQTMARP